jgi:GPH family glycoside/pentoside/hexuronide:cation symporter
MASDLSGAIAAAAIAGAGLGGVKVCREMIIATLVDRSLGRTGRRQEGIYYGLNRFFGRLSKILEALALILLGVLFGYVSGEDPGPDPASAFRFLMSVLPFIFMVAALLLARTLQLEAVDSPAQA